MAKIIIIGGGVAGLSAGIYAQRYGHEAIVCEQHSVAGGNLTGWQRGAYHIDNCIHWLTGTNPATDTYKMWVDLGVLGNDVEVYQAEHLYTCAWQGTRLSLYKDLEKLYRKMLILSPGDSKEIHSFIHAVKTLQHILGIGGKHHDEKSNLPQLLTALPELAKYHRLSTEKLAARFSHPLLQQFITAVMGKHFTAIALLLVIAVFCGENGGIPRGSSCAMAKRMTDQLLQLGGNLYLNKSAVKIHCRGEKASAVSFADGTTIPADYVVIATDPTSVFGKMLSAKMPTALAKQYKQPTMQRFSGYHCAFACDTAKLPFHGDFIFNIPSRCKQFLQGETVILREFSHEESFAPKGKNILQTTVFCDETDARRFISLHENTAAYEQRKQQIGHLMKILITTQFPALKGKLRCIDVWTPATYRRYTGTETGSFMSFTLPAKRLPHHLSNRVPHLNNILLATQWLQSPGGLPIAAGEGKRAIETILKLEKKA